MTGLETVSAGSLLVSKYLLAMGSVSGWIAAVVGYFLASVYNFKKSIVVLGVVTIGILLLCAYGWYKWSVGMKGLQIFDYSVIVLTVIFGLAFSYMELKARKPLWALSVIVTLLCMAAYILLGLTFKEGWYCLGSAHAFLLYIYYTKGAYVYTGLQAISIYIALTKVTSLPLPF